MLPTTTSADTFSSTFFVASKQFLLWKWATSVTRMSTYSSRAMARSRSKGLTAAAQTSLPLSSRTASG